ncbi:MAG: hypothetical protein WBA38_11735 [Gordonia sp. (in: high G+C Gram-positive bacteria)]|uniref:hypothetical protein n=1 Tax=Gordonia sp. (in: high G+C Gram-positive bacteria) TaxID=84139 RepID=UPI003C728608
MSKTTLRTRAISIAAAAAIAGGGLAVVPSITAGNASAAPCISESTNQVSDAVIPRIKYNFAKSTAKSVGQGTSVTYQVSLSTTGAGNPYVQSVWDSPSSRLDGVKPTVKVKAFTLIGGILGGGGVLGNLLEEKSVDPAGVVKETDGWRISHTGWSVYSGQAYVAEFTYALPKNLAPGAQIVSGGATFRGTPDWSISTLRMPKMTACTTVRAPNAGEAALGSLDKNGLGSAEGQLSSTGSLSDVLPGIIGGVIGGQGEEKK